MIKLKSKLKQDFLVLNLSDPQLTAKEWNENNETGRIFKKTVEALVKRVSPDLITVSGDLSYSGDFISYKNFADYFDSLCIPWTCCFGNHDNQSGAQEVRRVIDEYKNHKYFVFEECDPILGIGNFVILVEKDGNPATGLFLMDTHDRQEYKYDDGSIKTDWAGLSAQQLLWYKEQIDRLNTVGCSDSALIIHTPINAYGVAFKEAFNSNLAPKSVTLEESRNPAVWNKGYETSFGVCHEPITCCPVDEGAFTLIKELGSTKNVLSGHNHINNWMINYEGIRLAFALKTGVGSYHEKELNGGTVIKVSDGGVSFVWHEYVDITD